MAEAGAPYQFQTVSLDNNEQKSPAYLAINPSGKIPALKLPSGEIVTETAALLLIVAERHPGAALLPPMGTPERAQVLRWIAFMACEIYPMVEIYDYPARFAPEGESAEALKRKANDRMRERMLAVEQAVAGPWLLQSSFSVADLYAAMFSRWRPCRDWQDANLPKMRALAAAVAAREKTAPIWRRHFGS